MRIVLHDSTAKKCVAIAIVMIIVGGISIAIAIASHDGRLATIFRIFCFAIGASGFCGLGGYKESQARMKSKDR